MRALLVVVTTLACVSAGCAITPKSIPVRIYNVENGDVLSGYFLYTGYRGTVTASLATGVPCSGDYFTQDNRTTGSSVAWGSIYGWGMNNFSAVGITSQTVQPGSMAGTAILRCEDRNVIQCEYTVNRSNQGSGYCKDNQQGKYRFMF